MAKIKVKAKFSGSKDSIGSELRRRRDFLRKPIAVKIIVPTGGTDPKTNALEWVFWQEFGAGPGRQAAPLYGVRKGRTSEYPIPGKDNADPPDRMWFPPYKGRTYGFKKFKGKLITPKGYIITHPGYPPKRFIRNVLKEARQILRAGIREAIVSVFAKNSNPSVLEERLVEEMQQVKDLIVASMRSAFGTNKRKDGRLGGTHPAIVFDNAAQVVSRNTVASVDESTGKVRIKSRRRTSIAGKSSSLDLFRQKINITRKLRSKIKSQSRKNR